MVGSATSKTPPRFGEEKKLPILFNRCTHYFRFMTVSFYSLLALVARLMSCFELGDIVCVCTYGTSDALAAFSDVGVGDIPDVMFFFYKCLN